MVRTQVEKKECRKKEEIEMAKESLREQRKLKAKALEVEKAWMEDEAKTYLKEKEFWKHEKKREKRRAEETKNMEKIRY